MQTNRKWLFWGIFALVILLFWGVGFKVFHEIKNNWLSDSSIDDLRMNFYPEGDFNSDTAETVFGFNEVVRGFAYFVLALALLTFSYYFFRWMDRKVSQLEYHVIDSRLMATKGKYGEYSGRRI